MFAAGAALALSAPASPAAQTPEQSYSDWAGVAVPVPELEDRRARLAGALRETGGGVLLVASSEGVSGGETFRQSDNFWYLTGLEVPRSVLAVDADRGTLTAFVPRRDPRFESASRPNDFPGRPLADDPALAERSGLEVRPWEDFERELAQWVREGRSLRIDAGRAGPVPVGEPEPWGRPDPAAALATYLRHRGASPGNAWAAVASVRSVKTVWEAERMRAAARLTATAIREASAAVRPGVDERTLEGVFEAACKRGGSARLPFASIVKSGPNSLWPWRILAAHYDRRNRAVERGDLVIFDVGCELDHYVSDVGRTVPVSGRFDPSQREAMRTSIAVSDHILERVRPGVTLADLQTWAREAIPDSVAGYMQTGLFFGHHLGLSTGDPVDTSLPLRAGMVFTVEPWYYDHGRGVSVFIEDQVLVTETGMELLTSGLPRTVEGLEAMVTGAVNPAREPGASGVGGAHRPHGGSAPRR